MYQILEMCAFISFIYLKTIEWRLPFYLGNGEDVNPSKLLHVVTSQKLRPICIGKWHSIISKHRPRHHIQFIVTFQAN
jgi:hypothetical protein